MVLSVRAILQSKKAAIEDLENSLVSLKTDLISAFERQGTIEAEIRALREGGHASGAPSLSTYGIICYRIRKETEAKE